MRKHLAGLLVGLFLGVITNIAVAQVSYSTPTVKYEAGTTSLYVNGAYTSAPFGAVRDPIFAQWNVNGGCGATPCTVGTGPKNVTSIDRGSIGSYGVNFTTAYIGSAVYTPGCWARVNGGTGAPRVALVNSRGVTVVYIDTYEIEPTTGVMTKVDAEWGCTIHKDYTSYP